VVTAREIHEAAEGLRGIARRTPLVYVEALGAHLKLENEQPIGAFKIRGAYNAIRKLPDAARTRGVIT
jgi:threonine dehydratase